MKITLAEELTKGKDKYDPNTVCGCLNRIMRMMKKEKLSEQYNLDMEADTISWKFWLLQEASFWPADEIKFSSDREDYKNASEEEKNALDLVNGFFVGGDGIIVANLGFRFAIEAETMAEMGALLAQMKQEFVHAEVYTKLISTLIVDISLV